MMFRGKVRQVHFVGIGGSGMNGLAEVLLTLGFVVSGSDMKESGTVARLRSLGAQVFIGHRAENIVGADVIVRKIKGAWIAALNPDAMPKLRINRMYADILSRNRDASHQQLSGQLQEAKWLIKNAMPRKTAYLSTLRQSLSKLIGP